MNVGKLYQFKKYFWLIYPSKDIAALTAVTAISDTASTIAATAAYYGNVYNCNISYISPNSIFVLLEQDEKYCKILTTNGQLGWIYITVWCKDNIEEVTA